MLESPNFYLKKLVFIVSVLFFLLFNYSDVLAVNDTLFKVDRIAGKIEKVKEKLSLFLKFNKVAKVDYYQYLSEKRLAELVYAVENDVNSLEQTASRYSTYIGTLTNYVLANKITGEKQDLVSMFERHTRIIESLQKKFEFESGWWLAIQHDINSLGIFKDKIKALN